MPDFKRRPNPMSDAAWALIAYSTVPYLGILFVPPALVAGGLGKWGGGRSGSFGPIAAAVGMLAIQIFLWWLLYFVPTLHN